MEIQMFEKVIALSNVGSGSKSHIVDVFVGEPEIRYGRSSNTYSQPHVYCGSVRGWRNSAWGVTEISNRFGFEEMKNRTDDEREAWFEMIGRNNKARREAVVGSFEKVKSEYGSRLCEKCVKGYDKMMQRWNEQVTA